MNGGGRNSRKISRTKEALLDNAGKGTNAAKAKTCHLARTNSKLRTKGGHYVKPALDCDDISPCQADGLGGTAGGGVPGSIFKEEGGDGGVENGRIIKKREKNFHFPEKKKRVREERDGYGVENVRGNWPRAHSAK